MTKGVDNKNTKNDLDQTNKVDLDKEAKTNNEEDLSKKLDEINDKYLRLNADFENYRRRTSKEIIETISTANKKLILNILPIIDDFERSFETKDGFNKEAGFSNEDKENKSSSPISSNTNNEGIRHIYKKLIDILQKEGLSEIDIKKGEKFDPEKSEAITKIKSNKDLSNKIVDIIEKGYMLDKKIIRFAKVIIGE